MSGKIVKVSDFFVVAEGLSDACVSDIVRIGAEGLFGEILTITGDSAFIQVYDETNGLATGAEVQTTGAPLCAELGPGLLESAYDGVQRPLSGKSGTFALDRKREWHFAPSLPKGTMVTGGRVIGTVEENSAVSHKIMVPPGIDGIIESIERGAFTVEETVCRVKTANGTKDISLMQKWPVRVSRPHNRRLMPAAPLCTGQRAVDTLAPLAKGGAAAIAGPFGSGKTALLHQLARWADVDIVVYIGCGERGNEMIELINALSAAKDPRNGEPFTKRTVFITSTADMPVPAREAAIYTGSAIAEYFRDMGYDVALIADSTSRWAEALREISGKMDELPCEEGYPAYLASRIAQFYSRAGVFELSTGEERLRGSLSVIGAVSPPSGDVSEPVSQATARLVKSFLELDGSLACARHFPAVNRFTSSSSYADALEPWFEAVYGPNFMKNRNRMLSILQAEVPLLETVCLLGYDTLSNEERLTLETAKMFREDFLQQDFFADGDSYSPYEKQYALLDLILKYNDYCADALAKGADIQALFDVAARETLRRAKTALSPEIAKEYEALDNAMTQQISELVEGGGEL